ncbi:hypothetical protein OG331_50500 [Streptomyces sp. NBC_01017]|uniref:hypothetical protein n=1 Tax=Streptomyces sp. NBC_01017 TaxID=2903721 RepID=UPI003864923A|nr:hypothetical protein OG331_01475 [Streptomyces sp. NBC_01017]WSV35171.1 hypothetical protein OG331_50500 [Streptomyces sp. NBC_01017]
MTDSAQLPTAQDRPLSLGELIERSADLKRGLVQYVQGPRFDRKLTAALLEAAGADRSLEESTTISVIDQFALQHRLPDGRTPVERYADARKDLSPVERKMLLGWRDVVEGLFEIRARDGDALVLLNLIDELEYRTYSNMGRKVFRGMSKGGFVIGRLVPIAPYPGAWLVSGGIASYRKADGPQIAQIALETAAEHPALVFRNPDKIAQGWEQMHRDREAFIACFGADQVVLPPAEAQERLDAFHRHRWLTTRTATGNHDPAEPFPSHLSFQLPEDLQAADTVGIIYDATEGMNLYRDYGLLDALYANPALTSSRRHTDQLRSYVRDTSISPLPFQRLAEAHPDTVDTVISKVLRKPAFTWTEHGEAWLRRRKAEFYEREPRPGVSVIGNRLTELAAASRR